ncbi:hypothetical protein [Candidatus Mycoplasma haematominutum]|uniref:Uncharacterized protein n=1 Tax=Candidatus Mycoplasma haematominutum 'Birmingham 1' TaxID=1116213 RepID=G8C3G8_9MOLU|nr:hypothetical protein [Candidatus Mycoplasma haematominutum]CCE66866.1 hypothetical protein MHM_03480 [Candidatus Mycoplasma haematominutum 'Birmingham 1']
MILAKLISSGLASLSASGLGLYFIPKFSDSKNSTADFIYSTGEAFDSKKFSTLENSRTSLLQTLEGMKLKFQKITEELKKQREEKHNSLNTTFQNITQEEEKLKAEYEKGQKWLTEIGKIIKGIQGANSKKLQLDAIIAEIDYLNESLAKIYSNFRTWGFALEQFICAIDNQTQTKKCDKEELKDWLLTSTSETSARNIIAQTSSGGAQKPLKKHLLN